MSNLKYITFNELMASVESDLKSFADQGLIDRGDVIKVVRKVNEDIGLKIFRERQHMLEIHDNKAKLPEDFMNLQMAVACTIQEYYMGRPDFGTETEEHMLPTNVYQNSLNTCLNEKQGYYWVSQNFKNRSIKHERLVPLKLTKSARKLCSENCINFQWDNAAYDIDIQNGELITNFREGQIFINYLADMVDEEGNLLLLDHPLTTEYYEYAVKKQLLENFMMNNDVDAGVGEKLKYVKEELRQARIRGLSFVNTIEYDEIIKFYQVNRLRFYNKYHRIFN